MKNPKMYITRLDVRNLKTKEADDPSRLNQIGHSNTQRMIELTEDSCG